MNILEQRRAEQSGKSKKVNPLDKDMTKAQVVRRKFKSSLPRTIQNRVLSKMEAMARTMELFDRFISEMKDAKLSETDVSAGLVFCQPETPGVSDGGQTIALPKAEEIGTFVERVKALHKPLFLGVLFIQTDRDAKGTEKYRTIFVWPFMAGPEAEKRLLEARRRATEDAAKVD